MNDDFQLIVTLVVLFFALFLFLAPFVVFFIYVFFQNSKRKRIREKIQTTQQALLAGRPYVPVRYASEPRFKAWFKIFPWEGTGLLLTSPGSVTFVGETNAGHPLNFQFAPGQAAFRWLGKCPWPNGAVSWFMVDATGQKHYFTSETGAFIIGSDKTTKAAFDAAQRSLG